MIQQYASIILWRLVDKTKSTTVRQQTVHLRDKRHHIALTSASMPSRRHITILHVEWHQMY